MKIFLDMDDTLVDFMKGIKEWNIHNAHITKDYLHLPRDQWPENVLAVDGAVIDCMNTPNFFRDLPPMEGYHKLWSEANKLAETFVLTAWPKTCRDIPRVKSEKNYWCHSLLSRFEDSQFICCAREDKAKYAWEGHVPNPRGTGGQGWVGDSNVLIDDLEANISAWEKAGGIGILFKNSEQAINDLKKVFNATN